MMTSSMVGGGSLWKLRSVDEELLTEINRPQDLVGERQPLLFIHGVEYGDVQEALRDLVNPILDNLGRSNLKRKGIYIFSWNSLIVPREVSEEFLKSHPVKKFRNAIVELPKSPRYLSDIERRAREAASKLSPFVAEWNSQNKVGPTVITHSMGSLVWVEAMKRILDSSSMLVRPGIWWSLQPAMLRSSFSTRGDYHAISKLYTGHESARAMIWYSRMDFILSSIYMLAKPGLALGQWGCPENSIPQRDITKLAGEAHGMNHIARMRGDFFRRVKHLLPLEASNLGIF